MERLGGLLPHTAHIEIATKIASHNHTQNVGDRAAPGGTACSIPKTGIMPPNDTDWCAFTRFGFGARTNRLMTYRADRVCPAAATGP